MICIWFSRHGYFSGINRKVQFKLVNHRTSSRGNIVRHHPSFPIHMYIHLVKELCNTDLSVCVSLPTALLLILKWGGELTASGQRQAEELGRAFRCMYPGGEGEYASLPGSGFLRLHSTYRHDLKVYASDEGRVQMTAAAFTKVHN